MTSQLPRRAERGKLSARLCAGRINQVETTRGGTFATVGTVSPSFVPQYDPTAPFANANGQVAAPNVDPANEAVQQSVARYSSRPTTRSFRSPRK